MIGSKVNLRILIKINGYDHDEREGIFYPLIVKDHSTIRILIVRPF